MAKSGDGRHWLDFENIEFLGELIDYLRLAFEMYKYNKEKNVEKVDEVKELMSKYDKLSEDDKKKIKDFVEKS